MPGRSTSIAFAETLVLDGIAASIGSIGDAYDNAPAGAWMLQSYEARCIDGSDVTYSLGVETQG